MRLEKACLISLISLIVVGIAVATAQAETFDQVRVKIPNRVKVADKILEPGDYLIRQVEKDKVEISKSPSDPMKVAAKIGVLEFTFAEPAKETKVILHHSGGDYVLDQIWMQGKPYYFKFAKSQTASFEAAVPANPDSGEQVA